ncbi:hypothetical protein [Natronorubrum halophilum]|uniref:hypothetical protein n=1 Tax=Natronorubrum halophilum TaxID=1702106 RepID=UPI000EF65D60|nr:hypothetical protein [Natronorubrum halophilum]
MDPVSVPISLPDGSSPLWRYLFLAAFGVLVLARILFDFELIRAAFSDDGSAARTKTNCPLCGARIPVESNRCGYCDEPLER